MLNMQNVKDIEITEGDVRTIHDKNSRLIWGRLAYDTKYAGDTLQNGTPTPDAPIVVQTVTGEQTVTISDGIDSHNYPISLTGKNLIDPTNLTYVYANSPTQIVLSTIDDGIRMVNNGGASQDRFAVFKSVDLTPYVGKVVRMKATFGTGGGIRLYRIASDGSGRSQQATTTVSDNEISFTVPADLGTSNYLGYVLDVTTGSGTTVDFTNLIMTIDSPIDRYAAYYNYELCKIGDYQDYIYKSGDDWYVHKEFGKYVFNGSETIAYNSSNGGFTINTANLPNYMPNHATPPMVGLSSHFSVNPTTTTWTGDNRIGLSSSGTFWCKATSFATSLNDCLAWLTANTPSVYYALDTANDTKITDATLVGQLNAIHKWLTRYGYSSTVTGNLPIIISKTNL